MRKYFSSLLIAIMLLLSSCSSMVYIYNEPIYDMDKDNYSIILDKNYDEVWSNLIEYSASTFFAIDNFEKASGLITLDFGASNPSEFITGGFFSMRDVTYDNQIFKGDYVDFISESTLDGRMNIYVTRISENKTKVNIHARYIINSGNGTIRTFETGNYIKYQVSYFTEGISPYRIICPTYKAENAIIEALKK